MLLSQDLRKSLEEQASHYEQQVQLAGEYLQARGVTPEVARARRLGYVGTPLVGGEQYVGRVVIPYLTPAGVVDVRYRAIHDGTQPKYLSRPGAEQRMYGVAAFDSPLDYIAITEGEFDSIIVNDLCGIPAVGIPGANGWKPFYWRAFEDYSRVLVFTDGDQAGKEFSKKIAQDIQSAVIVPMPDGMDVNDVYLSEGAEGVRRRAGL